MAFSAGLKRIEKKLDLILVTLNAHGEKLNKLHADFYDESENNETKSSSDASENVNEVPDPEFLFPKEKIPSHVWKVSSYKDPETKYSVSLYNDGWTCTCPAFKFRKNEDYVCKHIKDIKNTEF